MARLVLVIVTALGLAGLAACAAEPGRQASPIGTGAPVLVPGSPGAPARTATPGERVGRTPRPTVAADVRFAEAMIPHHRQALEMTSLVEARTTTTVVRNVARAITAAQTPEIRAMTSWLAELGRPAPAAHEHGAAATGYGMASEEELTALRAARGPAFDRLFLRLMTRHHEGAVKMAGEELAGGRDHRMRLLARDVYSGQSIEIARMRTALESLPGVRTARACWSAPRPDP
ncbi:DUF305 domain-containing protein [Actinomadura sp. ATCC 31491]|uniref:DUF305 domain-containing protein n=1 Tax=Actinomadura luzonensis TaxID=2805427 RepID=A0ABT0FWT7_9ACTN|nr:DUF305 domain-containing protein [Actinomadura luzonensis]MCK2216790.1 DUF305 domain-containing protein [Actinomadura luzonensis]